MAVVPGAGSSYPSGAPIQYAPPKATSTSAPSTSAPATTATQTTAQAGATPAAGDRQAAIAAITKEAARLQGEVNRFAAREAETKVTTSSGGAKDNESRTGKDITDMRAPNYAAPTRDLSYIDDYMERLLSLIHI